MQYSKLTCIIIIYVVVGNYYHELMSRTFALLDKHCISKHSRYTVLEMSIMLSIVFHIHLESFPRAVVWKAGLLICFLV